MTQGWVVYGGMRHAEPQREMFPRSYNDNDNDKKKMTQGWVVYGGMRHAEPQREMFPRSYIAVDILLISIGWALLLLYYGQRHKGAVMSLTTMIRINMNNQNTYEFVNYESIYVTKYEYKIRMHVN
jgi:hypothetical protein